MDLIFVARIIGVLVLLGLLSPLIYTFGYFIFAFFKMMLHLILKSFRLSR